MLLPATGRLGNRAVWQSEHNQAQFEQWALMLRDLGLSVDSRQLQSRLWALTRWYLQWRRPIKAWLSPVDAQLGIDQGWAMFSNPQTHPGRLHIDVDRGSGWEPLYVSRSDEHAWHRSQFDHNRMRKLVGRIIRGGRRGSYSRLVRWIGERAREDFPTARRVRVRLYRWTTQAPGSDEPIAKGHFDDTRVVALEGSE